MKNKLLILNLIIMLYMVIVPITVFALSQQQINTVPTQSILSNTTTNTNASTAAASGGDLKAWLAEFYVWAIGLGGALAIFMIAFAAIDYASSGGDVEKMNGAKEKIVGAVVGLLLLVLTYLIVNALHTAAPTNSGTGAGTSNNAQSQIDPKTGTEGGVVSPSTNNSNPAANNPNPQVIPEPPAPSA